MKQQTNSPTISVKVQDLHLKVIRVGETPRLPKGRARERRLHSHFTYEIFFVTEGILTLVSERSSTAYERKVVIIPPRMGHYTVSGGEGDFCLLFSFEKSKLGQDAAKAVQARLDAGVCELPLSDDVSFYVRTLAKKTEEKTVAGEFDADLLATLIFSELMRILDPRGQERCPLRNDSKHIAAIETYLNAHYHHRVTLADVAARVYLSTRQVSRILKNEYGCTLSQLLLDKRLAQAQMLLRSTDLPVREIAQRVCMGSENYFYAVFKKRFGTSPLQYRKRQRSI